jgi:multidrug transporter EmrE-like cation transporter
MKELSLILISVFLGAAGQIGFKYGALRIPDSGALLTKAITAWPIIVGLLLYGVSTILWIYVLRFVELSYAYPLISLGYVLVFLASYFLFNEPIGTMRLAGLILILAGIILVSRS